jgi:hypothetical protein
MQVPALKRRGYFIHHQFKHKNFTIIPKEHIPVFIVRVISQRW